MDVIDNCIHTERLDENHLQKTFTAILNTLPNGAFIKLNNNAAAYLWYGQQLYQWSFGGYQKITAVDTNQAVQVLTPASYVEVFKLGYEVQVHVSAQR
jgi:hypothetical protein